MYTNMPTKICNIHEPNPKRHAISWVIIWISFPTFRLINSVFLIFIYSFLILHRIFLCCCWHVKDSYKLEEVWKIFVFHLIFSFFPLLKCCVLREKEKRKRKSESERISLEKIAWENAHFYNFFRRSKVVLIFQNYNFFFVFLISKPK